MVHQLVSADITAVLQHRGFAIFRHWYWQQPYYIVAGAGMDRSRGRRSCRRGAGGRRRRGWRYRTRIRGSRQRGHHRQVIAAAQLGRGQSEPSPDRGFGLRTPGQRYRRATGGRCGGKPVGRHAASRFGHRYGGCGSPLRVPGYGDVPAAVCRITRGLPYPRTRGRHICRTISRLPTRQTPSRTCVGTLPTAIFS